MSLGRRIQRRGQRGICRYLTLFKLIVILLVLAQGLVYIFPAGSGLEGKRQRGARQQQQQEALIETAAQELHAGEAETRTNLVKEIQESELEEEEVEESEIGDSLPVFSSESQESGREEVTKAKQDIFQPCLSEKEAEQRGAVYQIHSARPKGMSLKEFQKIEKCWRRRKRTEELYPPSKLPPLGTDLQVMMTREEVENLIFLHEENLGKLGQAVTDDSGNTLTDLVAEGKLKNAVPANASDAHRNQRFSDCAVVASGATLQGASLGKKIDEHQVVVRINQAPTASSKRIVGSKTSIRLINNLWTKSYAKADLRRKAVESGSSSTPVEGNLTIYVTRPSADDYMKLLRHSQQFRKDVELRIVSSRIVSMVRDRLLAPYRKKLEMAGVDEFKAALLEGRDTPSSGLVAVFLMIQLCGSVTAYGFSGINDGSKYHYWKSNRQYQNRTHSFSAERALLRRLAYELDTFFFVEGNTDNVKSFV